MKRSPLLAKRAAPRRQAPERVRHERQKPKAGAAPTAVEKRHHDRLREVGCLVAYQNVIASHRCAGRVTIHHVSAPITGGRIARDHRLVVPLCQKHHQIQHGPHESVERLGHYGFYLVYGIDLLSVADWLWRETEAMEAESTR